MLRGVRSWLSATIPRLASSASPKVGVGAGAEEPTRASLLQVLALDASHRHWNVGFTYECEMRRASWVWDG